MINKGLENNNIPRICFSTDIDSCIAAIIDYNHYKEFTDREYSVYVPENEDLQKITNNEIIRKKYVYDAHITHETWIIEPVKLKKIGTIFISSKIKKEIKFKDLFSNNDHTRYYYWSWVNNNENNNNDKIVYQIYWHDKDKVPIKYIKDIIEYEYYIDTQSANFGNYNFDIIKETIDSWEDKRHDRKYNYILAIDQEKDKVIGSVVFYYGFERNINEYFNLTAKKSIFFAYFFVNPKYRNKGIGSSIIRNIELMNRYPIKSVQLKVMRKNVIAYNLYTKLGYKPIFTDYYIFYFNTSVSIPNEIAFNKIILEKIINSIKNKLLLFNNNRTLNEIVNNIINNINNKIYTILDVDNNYIIVELFSNKVVVWDILLNEEYTFILFNKILKSIYSYAQKYKKSRVEFKNIYINNQIDYYKFNLIPYTYTMIKYI